MIYQDKKKALPTIFFQILVYITLAYSCRKAAHAIFHNLSTCLKKIEQQNRELEAEEELTILKRAEVKY